MQKRSRHTIHIDDLASPQLNETQRSILAFDKEIEVSFSVEGILDEARQVTGLSDFGDMEFLTRLRLLCESWDADTGLNNLGRMNLRSKLLQFTQSRLLIQELLKRHPEIHEVQIQAPIIVAGLPRSGTTHLLNLMAADTRLRSLPLWESYEPVPMPGEVVTRDENDPRYQRCDQQWQSMQSTLPHMAAMHPMNPDHIHEELELMGPDFASYNFEWLNASEAWRDHYYASDQTPHYDYMKTVLKILTWQDGDDGGNTRWVLKCPQHMEQLPILKRVFPDATVAITHRDPVSVIQSTVTMLAYGQRMSRYSIAPENILQYWRDRIRHLLKACVRDRDCWPESQSIDVPFHQFMADDMGMIQRIYDKAGLALTEQARQQLQDFIVRHPRGKYGQVIYDLPGQFGVDPAHLRRDFDFYFDAFPVEPERKGESK